MVLRADGVIIGQWDVPTTSLASYTVDAALAAGDVTLRIEFTNDFNTNGDRNLRVDVLTVEVASTALPATIEAENFEYKSTGGVYPNAAWSGGKGWNIWNTGGIEHTVHNPGTAKYRFTIKAAGDLAGPDPPRMVLKVNGAIIAQWDVTSEALWPYTVDATLQPGDARLRIEFTNDYNQLGDRNLRVDLIQIAATAPTLPGSFEAENFEFKSTGGVYPNAAWSGGKGWNIWSLGHIDQRVYNPTARTATVTIKAAGDAAANVAPHMVLKANGAVIGEWDVTSSSLLSYATTVALGAGDVTFWIEFTNDYNQNGQDRNLRVDVLQVT
jgi:hypothetical protein